MDDGSHSLLAVATYSDGDGRWTLLVQTQLVLHLLEALPRCIDAEQSFLANAPPQDFNNALISMGMTLGLSLCDG